MNYKVVSVYIFWFWPRLYILPKQCSQIFAKNALCYRDELINIENTSRNGFFDVGVYKWIAQGRKIIYEYVGVNLLKVVRTDKKVHLDKPELTVFKNCITHSIEIPW